jgi:hypothetical protein
MDVLVKEVATQDLDTLVVIGDGTPDDIAFSIIAFHLNGDKIAWIVKPKEEKRVDCVGLIPAYLKGNIRKIIFLMDQEDDKLNTIYERIHEGVKKLATGKIKVIDEESEKRLKVYECKYGSKEFELILVINGLDEIHTDKHSIEDHLLKAAKMLSIDAGDFGNSKAAWKSITHDRQSKIYKELKAHRKLVESVFPQHVQGCNYLMEGL